MADIITTLHPENDENTNLYPNIKKENIPNGSIDESKLSDSVNNTFAVAIANISQPKFVSTLPTTDVGLVVYTDGYIYSWNGTAYTSTNVLYQATQIAKGSIDILLLEDKLKQIITASAVETHNYNDLNEGIRYDGSTGQNYWTTSSNDYASNIFPLDENVNKIFVSLQSYNSTNFHCILFVNANSYILDQAVVTSVSSVQSFMLDVPENAKKIIVSSFKDGAHNFDKNDFNLIMLNTNITSDIETNKNDIDVLKNNVKSTYVKLSMENNIEIGNISSIGTNFVDSTKTRMINVYYPHTNKITIHNPLGLNYWVFWYNGDYIGRETAFHNDVLKEYEIDQNVGFRILFNTNNINNVNSVYVDYHKSDIIDIKKVFFDTDCNSDVDDVIALRCLAWAHTNKIIDTQMIATSTNSTQVKDGVTYYQASFIDAILQYNGINDIPIKIRNGYNNTSVFYANVVSNFYHTINTNDAVDIGLTYRKYLARIPEGQKATIIVTGFLSNISDLLNSVADIYSNLNGVDLVSEKVDKIVIMGGRYPSSTSIETNFSRVSDTNNVLVNSPVPLIFLGQEFWDIYSGQSLIDNNVTYDPLYVALHDYWTSRSGHDDIQPRSSWDPLTTLLGCLDDVKIGMYSIRGTNSIDTDTTSSTYGYNTFTPNNSGNHYYVVRKYNNKYYEGLIDSLLLNKKGWL